MSMSKKQLLGLARRMHVSTVTYVPKSNADLRRQISKRKRVPGISKMNKKQLQYRARKMGISTRKRKQKTKAQLERDIKKAYQAGGFSFRGRQINMPKFKKPSFSRPSLPKFMKRKPAAPAVPSALAVPSAPAVSSSFSLPQQLGQQAEQLGQQIKESRLGQYVTKHPKRALAGAAFAAGVGSAVGSAMSRGISMSAPPQPIMREPEFKCRQCMIQPTGGYMCNVCQQLM